MSLRADTRPGLFRRPYVTDWLTFVIATVVSLAALGLVKFLPQLPLVVLFPFVMLGCATLLWRFPRLNLYTLFVSATLIEQWPLFFPDSTTDRIPFWWNLSTIVGAKGVPISPAELLMVTGIVVWLLRGLLSRELRLRGSGLLGIYGLYLLVVVIGDVRGIISGGDFIISLWEVRAEFYAAIACFLAINLLQTRSHFDTVGWLIILGTGLKGVQGTMRYLITFGHHFTGEALLGHEEALFFPAYYIFLLLMFVFGGDRRQKRAALMFLPFVLVADLENKRRASTGAVLICLLALIFILYTVLVKYRGWILIGAFVGLVLVSVYTGAFWNSTSTIARPLKSIKSQIAPDERDASSNLYRDQENINLMFAIRKHPILGQGYGIPMDNVAGMVDLTDTAVFIFYMPHNSILWVWWRLGLIGSVLFWIASGMAIVRNCFLVRAASDPYIQRWAVFAIAVVIMALMIAWWDQGLIRYRIGIYEWTILAIPEILGREVRSLHAMKTEVGANP